MYYKSKILCLFILTSFCVAPLFTQGSSYKGLLIDPPRKIERRTLINQDSQSIEFPTTNSRYQVVFFGFTHCPMVCPRGLQKMKQVMALLGKKVKATDFIFISIDPDRDTPARLKEFLPKYNEKIIGLTGQLGDISAAQKQFNVVTRKFQGKTAEEYSMEHSAYIYVLNKEDQIMILYSATASAEDIAADLKKLP